jgi:hypothetical protein
MHLNKKSRISIASLVILLSMAVATFAQGREGKEAGCALLDKNYAAQFISYEGHSEPSSEIRLRVHNNSNCPIMVETDDVLPTQIVKLQNGGVKIEPVKGPHDGTRLSLHYLIQDPKRRTAPRAAYGWGDSVFTYEIPAGQSVVFNVRLSYFVRGVDIAVPFNYSWEKSRSIGMGVGGVVHRIYYLAQELPKATRRKRP